MTKAQNFLDDFKKLIKTHAVQIAFEVYEHRDGLNLTVEIRGDETILIASRIFKNASNAGTLLYPMAVRNV